MKRYTVRPTPPASIMHGLKWDIVDQETNKIVDQATTRYAARMIAEGWAEGIYQQASE